MAQDYHAIDDPTRFRRAARRAKRVRNVATPVLSSRPKFWNFTPKLRTIQADATRAIVSASAFCISSADCANGADRFIHTKIGGPQIYPVPGHQNKHASDRIFPSTEEATKRRMLQSFDGNRRNNFHFQLTFGPPARRDQKSLLTREVDLFGGCGQSPIRPKPRSQSE